MEYTKDQLKLMAKEAAETHNIDVRVFFSVIEQESTWNPYAGDPQFCYGLMQISRSSHPECNIDVVAGNLECGAKILSAYYKEFRGDWALTLASYHMGRERIRSFGDRVPDYERNGYVWAVLERAKKIELPTPEATVQASATMFSETPAPIMISTATPVPSHISTPTPTPTFTGALFFMLPIIWALLSK